MWPRLQNQPVQNLYCLSINLYPRKIGNTDPVRETRSWYNLIGEVVQSLYGLLFEQSSPSIPVAIESTVPGSFSPVKDPGTLIWRNQISVNAGFGI